MTDQYEEQRPIVGNIYPPYHEWLVVYNELRFWATATGAASRERREETAREEEGENSESAACSKCGYVCFMFVSFTNQNQSNLLPPMNNV